MSLSHRKEDVIVAADKDAVGVGQNPLAPLCDEITFPVEDHQGVFAGAEHIYPSIAVRHRLSLAQGSALGSLAQSLTMS